ncbi:hypothetical protein C4544_07640 [candidate division WS5 bacterium]|uniref:Glycosyltransferase RgtA/B/C/D-like domain-containing protein n=1 Tax=candidate division WS5 bacterium TaxID=2093353 RepID=A0A419D9P3_9BACT|nr:MAG: hypothetical protein C4544_07640 [candidate division WS5 bacterium]
MKSVSLLSSGRQIIIILLTYFIFAGIFGFAYRYALNPDGISHLRLAGYIAEGHFYYSIVSGWSPLLSWLIAPLISMGFEGQFAARIAIALSGAGLLGCTCMFANRLNLSEKIKFIALVVSALLISFWTIQFIAADVLVAFLSLLYFYFVTASDILKNRKVPFICGIVGGVSYLAHHYAFPFFLVHFPASLFLKGYIDRDKDCFPLKKILASWGLGIAGFAIIASIWIGTMSIRYGTFTISSKGPIAHAAMGPRDIDRRPTHFYGGLHKPKNEYSIHVFEDPSGLKFNTWSPFESKEYFNHQMKIIRENILYVRDHFITLSPFFTHASILVLIALAPLSLLLNKNTSKMTYMYFWIVMTFLIYCSGYILLIARSPRRFYVLMIVFLLLAFHLLEMFNNVLSTVISARRKKVMTTYLLFIACSAFVIKPGIEFAKAMKNVIMVDQVNPYGEIAEKIRSIQFPTPYAIIRSSQKPPTDLYIAYFLNKQLLGRPLSSDAEGISKELLAAGAKSLLVFDHPEIVTTLKQNKMYIHLGTIRFNNVKKYSKTVNINIRDHEILTGWDSEVTIFKLN